MVGYIYKFTFLPTGKIYVGKRKSNVFDDNYYGSGKNWKPLVKRYGKDCIKREILEWCEDETSLNEQEKYWIKSLDSRNPSVGYNLSKGGSNPILEGPSNAMFGKTHTQEARNKISEHHKGLKRDDIFKKRRSEFMINKHWYNNGVNEKYFLDHEVPDGYVLGRLKNKHKQKTLSEKDIIRQNIKDLIGEDEFKKSKKFVVNNGRYELMLPVCPEGFQKGRLTDHNLKIGIGNKGKSVSESTRLKLSQKSSGKNNGMYGVHRIGEDAPTYGKIMSDNTKKLIAESKKGKIWVNNGIESKLIHEKYLDYYINNGFKRGRVRY